MADEVVTKKERRRSPSYPSINLEQAIIRAREIWIKEGDHATPVTTIFKHWGYQSAAGNGNLVIAALRKFGLLDYEGSGDSRKARLTPLANTILRHPNEDQKAAAVKDAALLPSIHAELWEKYRDRLPSDDSLTWELEQERGFTRTGAAEFVPELRQTLSFAGLIESDSVGPQGQPTEGVTADEQADLGDANSVNDRSSGRKHSGRSRVSAGGVTYAVPVAAGEDVTVEGHFPLTEMEWAQFMAVLTAMKPALVQNDDRGSVESANEREQE